MILMLERILHMIDFGKLSMLDGHLDDIKSPRELAGSQPLEPGIGSTFDECLFLFSHRIEAADLKTFAAGLYFDEQQQPAIPSDEIHLATVWTTEIPCENFTSPSTQEIRRDFLTISTDPVPVAGIAVRRIKRGRGIERAAETADQPSA